MSFLMKTEEGLVNIAGGSSSGDGFNYPDENAMPGDQLYVKEVGADGKPTKWTYQTLEGFNVYDTNSKTEYTSYTGSLNGYNFLNTDGEVEHVIYRIDASNLSIDGENQLFGIGDSMTIVSTKDKKNYTVIKRIDNDTVVAYNYVNKELAKTDTLLVFEKKPITVYGFHINSNESNPSNAVTYLEEAVGLTPAFMNYSTNTFNYGSWENAFFMPRPCMLKSNGEVAYYLNPNDYSKKEDGSASDITNASFDGNAMMEWGQNGKQIWIKKVADAGNKNSVSVYIADSQADEDYHAWSFIDKNGNLKEHFYTPIYQGSLISNKLRSLSTQNLMESTTAEQEINYATANGSGWNTEVWCDLELIQDLLVLMSKSLDTQTAFGMGNCNGYNSSASSMNSGFEYHYGMLKPGSMNTKGLFWGKNTSVNTNGQRTGVKVFGMENLWANQYRRFAGMINDNGIIKIKKCYGISDGSTTANYNLTGSGYINTGVTPTGSSGGYINKMDYSVGSNIPSTASGSETTYFCDVMYFSNSDIRYAFLGGVCHNGVGAGAFFFGLSNAASSAGWVRGAALSYK